MADIFVRRTLHGLEPTDAAGTDVLRHIPQGEILKAKITRPRNVKHHRLFFKMLQVVWQNQERFATVDALLGALKVYMGHCDFIQSKQGMVALPRSISFGKMDQTEFREFFDRAVDVVCREVIPGLHKDDLLAEVMEMVGD